MIRDIKGYLGTTVSPDEGEITSKAHILTFSEVIFNSIILFDSFNVFI